LLARISEKRGAFNQPPWPPIKLRPAREGKFLGLGGERRIKKGGASKITRTPIGTSKRGFGGGGTERKNAEGKADLYSQKIWKESDH